jgi:hypothetical protein
MTNNSTNKKPIIFRVTKTPKGLDGIISLQPNVISQYYCAVINVSDSQCSTFDYQPYIPSFWFPINEIGQWGRSPSVAYAVLLTKGYTPEAAEESLQYEELSKVFLRNIERKHIPNNIIKFLKIADEHPELSLSWCLRKMDSLYEEWASKTFDEQNDCTVETEDGNPVRLVYNKEKKKFTLVKDEEPKEIVTPWVEPKFKGKEWYVTPMVPETK